MKNDLNLYFAVMTILCVFFFFLGYSWRVAEEKERHLAYRGQK